MTFYQIHNYIFLIRLYPGIDLVIYLDKDKYKDLGMIIYICKN